MKQNLELINIKKRMDELRKLKLKIIEKKRMEKNLKKKNGRNGNSNALIRVSHVFDNHLNFVQKKRIENGTDEFLISKLKLTGLIIRHKNWEKIKEDLIDYKLNQGNEDER